MPGVLTEPNYDAGVLDPTVRIDEPRPDRTRCRIDGLLGEMLQPVVGEHHGVVVEEHQHLAGGGLDCLIVELGEVESSGPGQDSHPRV